MPHPLSLTILSLAAAAPTLAHGQSWPAAETAGLWATGDGGPADARAPTPTQRIALFRAVEPNAAPSRAAAHAAAEAVRPADVPAKAAWTDDEGMRLKFAQIVYKRRF